MTTRRQFVLKSITAALALTAVREVSAAPERLKESDPAAASLGYHIDAAKVDAKKYPTYKVGHDCAKCQFYQGKPGEKWGPCAAFGGKLVSPKGWCAAWVQKA